MRTFFVKVYEQALTEEGLLDDAKTVENEKRGYNLYWTDADTLVNAMQQLSACITEAQGKTDEEIEKIADNHNCCVLLYPINN